MKDLKYDIFISYAHAINDITHRGDGEGIVYHFLKNVQAVFRNISGTKLKPWLDDDKLACGDTLKKISDDGLKNSKLFVPILSPAYYKSEWCRKEFLEFSKLQSSSSENRILPIVFIPFDTDDEKELTSNELIEFEKIKKIMKQSEEENIVFTNFFEINNNRPHLPNPQSDFFDKQCQIFAQDLKGKLREIINLELDSIDSKPAIFLGFTSNESLKKRLNILDELINARRYKNLDYLVLPEESINNDSDSENTLQNAIFEAEKFTSWVEDLIKFSNASFHIVDSRYGLIPEGKGSKLSILEIQYNIAAARAKEEGSNFQCFVQINSVSNQDDRQTKFIKKIKDDIECYPDNFIEANFESAKELSEILISSIQVKIPKNIINEQEQLLLLCCNSKDMVSSLAQQIDDFVYDKKKIEVRKPILCGKDEDAEKDYYDSLEKCNKAIIFLGSEASPAWCNSKKIDILKSANNRKVSFAKKAIYVTNPDVEIRMKQVRSREFDIIKCEKDNEQFIDHLKEFVS